MSENHVSEAADNTSDGAPSALNSDDVNNGDVVQTNTAQVQQASAPPQNSSAEPIRPPAERNDQQQIPNQSAAGIHHSISV